MTRPVVGAVTALVYDGLPEGYRDSDEGLGYPLLRYLALVLDQVDVVHDLVADFLFVPVDDSEHDDTTTSSTLVSPADAEPGWLPWLAQLVGVRIPAGASLASARALLADPPAAWPKGSAAALRAAVEAALTDTQTLTIANGPPWSAIHLATLRAETPSNVTWGELQTAAPTWSALQALGSFANSRTPGVFAAAEQHRPAGFTITHAFID